MRLLTWNLERHGPASWQGRELARRITAAAPDVACLTEAHEDSLAALGGHSVSAVGVQWSTQAPGERKVLLWSRHPWQMLPSNTELDGLGGFVSGTTETPLGRLQVLGVCIPYHMAAPVGMRPKPAPWSQQIAFINALKPVVAALRPDLPAVVVGDYNQFLPRIWGSKAAEAALLDCLRGMTIATSGLESEEGRKAVDHVACSSHLLCERSQALSERMPDRRRLSDHFGLVANLETDRRSR